MAWRITDAREEQLGQIRALETACFSEPWTEDQLRGQLRDGMHEFLVAEAEDGEVLGYVGMTYVLDEGYLSNVAVAPGWRRQGLAQALLKALLERARALELAFVTLEVRRGNAPAVALYEKLGFSPVGERKNYYERPREDALLMTSYLK